MMLSTTLASAFSAYVFFFCTFQPPIEGQEQDDYLCYREIVKVGLLLQNTIDFSINQD